MSVPTPAQRQVWEALSRLYLDVPCEAEREAIVRTLANAPFALTELRQMLLHEVHPVLIGNLRSAAGVWDGFDADWLAQAICAFRARRWRWPDRCCWRGEARRHWAWLAPHIAARRRHAPASAPPT
ncbi:DUF7079 family protein [Xanthomonas maliensis]|uniref:DUF7079 family protein n=1 Tax=Xanthomonas maliensis TaxID=1321368 RepID=UPI00039DF5EF|nr:hypothetical protein [Xanthomonas maliensis]KAB7769660.1 hypothetical protein CKY51_05800 [Xanthomonas maliensis]